MSLWHEIDRQLRAAYTAGLNANDFDMLAARNAVLAAVHNEFPRSRDDEAREAEERR